MHLSMSYADADEFWCRVVRLDGAVGDTGCSVCRTTSLTAPVLSPQSLTSPKAMVPSWAALCPVSRCQMSDGMDGRDSYAEEQAGMDQRVQIIQKLVSLYRSQHMTTHPRVPVFLSTASAYPNAHFDLLYLQCDKGQSGRTVVDASGGPQTSGKGGACCLILISGQWEGLLAFSLQLHFPEGLTLGYVELGGTLIEQVIYTAIHLQSEEEQRLYGAEDNMMARFLIHFLSLSASVPPREQACWVPGGCCELTHQFERKTHSCCAGPVSLPHRNEGQDVLTCERWVMEAVIWAGTVQAVQNLGSCLAMNRPIQVKPADSEGRGGN
ncbi:hypothetical protein D9C73_003884 [Collichthys lucidus]|uniref:Uncharacterized protein n=1 Tax=Collichthys lucidus TaxID=240159 RepID=A0A4U5U6B1_COLLU|nr:hypothetical protein D9C73_003884 [Collichthys lucidus]